MKEVMITGSVRGIQADDTGISFYCVQEDVGTLCVIDGVKAAVFHKLNAADIYKAAADYPLSEKYEKEIRSELEFEPPIPYQHRWTPDAVKEAVPALYDKYCEHGYALEEM